MLAPITPVPIHPSRVSRVGRGCGGDVTATGIYAAPEP